MGTLSIFEIVTKIFELLILIAGGGIIAILTYKRSCYDAIWKFYELETTPEQIAAREIISDLPDDYMKNLTEEQRKHVLLLANHYQNLGSLVMRHHLPLKMTYNSPIGISVIKYYEKLKPYIDSCRNGTNKYYQNECYANDFEWLYNKLKKK